MCIVNDGADEWCVGDDNEEKCVNDKGDMCMEDD